MRLPRARFTLQWIMLAVAGAANILGAFAKLQRRHDRFLDLAKHHEASSRIRLLGGVGMHVTSRRIPLPSLSMFNALGEDVGSWSKARLEWLRRLGAKYRRAARSPLLPVEPNQPEPE
jgi:hypothetical protein